MRGVVIDAGPLVAILDEDDNLHRSCRLALETLQGPLWTVWPVITEAVYLLRGVPGAAQDKLLGLVESGRIGILALDGEDIPRLRALMLKYRDLPMDLADAAVVRVAEREGFTRVFTTDRRHFRVYRPSHVRRFELLP